MQADFASALAWAAFSEQERDWLAGCFYVVGLGVAAADGHASREELGLLQRSVGEIANGTPSFPLARAATRFLQERRLADHFLPRAVIPLEEGRSRLAEAVAGGRSVIAKLPETDRHQFGAALLATALAVMDTKGSTKADHIAGARVFEATAEALGIDLQADLAWVQKQRAAATFTTTVGLLAGVAWVLSAALMGYFALQLMLADSATPGALGNLVLAMASAYVGGHMILAQLGFRGIPSAYLTPRQASQRNTWNGLVGLLAAIGVPTDVFAGSVAWGVLAVAWQGSQMAQGVGDPAYVGSTGAAVAAVVLSLVARLQLRRRKPESR